MNNAQPTRAIRINQICNNPAKGTLGILDMCKSSWWSGVKSGIYPQPFKLNPRTTVWDSELVQQVANGTYQGLKNVDQTKCTGRKPKKQQV